MKLASLLIVSCLLTGCAQLFPEASVTPQEAYQRRAAAVHEAERMRAIEAQNAQAEAEAEATCARQDLDQGVHNWCMRREQIKADRLAQAEREREHAERERTNRMAEEEMQAREARAQRRDRQEAIDRAFAPWRAPPPPIVVPQTSAIQSPRTCTSMVNGNLVTTTCN